MMDMNANKTLRETENIITFGEMRLKHESGKC